MTLFLIAAICRPKKTETECKSKNTEAENSCCAEYDKLTEAIQTNIAEADRLRLNSCTWIVSFEGTASELNEKVGIRGGKSGLALVAQVEDTAGFGPKLVGEWLRSHSEK